MAKIMADRESLIKKAANLVSSSTPSLGGIVTAISGDIQLGMLADRASQAAKDAARSAAEAVNEANKSRKERKEEEARKSIIEAEQHEEVTGQLSGVDEGVQRVSEGIEQLVQLSEREIELRNNERLDRIEAERENRRTKDPSQIKKKFAPQDIQGKGFLSGILSGTFLDELFLFRLAEKGYEDLQKQLGKIFGRLKKGFIASFTALGALFSPKNILKLFKKILSRGKNIFKLISKNFTKISTRIVGGLFAAFEGLNFAREMLEGKNFIETRLGKFVVNVRDFAFDKIESMLNSFENIIGVSPGEILTKVGEGLSNLTETISNSITSTVDNIKNIDFMAFLENANTSIVRAMGKYGIDAQIGAQMVGKDVPVIGAFFGGVGGLLIGTMTAAVEKIAGKDQGARFITNKIEGTLDSIRFVMLNTVNNYLSGVIGLVESLPESIRPQIAEDLIAQGRILDSMIQDIESRRDKRIQEEIDIRNQINNSKNLERTKKLQAEKRIRNRGEIFKRRDLRKGLTPRQIERRENRRKGDRETPIRIQKTNELGFVSKEFESGRGGPGTISSGIGDKGGKSYGLFQLSSKEGTLQKFLSTFREIGMHFDGLTPGSPEFDKKWKELALIDPKGFANAQRTFIKKTHSDPTLERLAKKGIFLQDRGTAIQEMVFSTATQFGESDAAGLISSAIKSSGKNASQLSDSDIIRLVQDRKIKNNETLFRNSNKQIRAGTLARARKEKRKLLALAESTPTLRASSLVNRGSTKMNLGKTLEKTQTAYRITQSEINKTLTRGSSPTIINRQSPSVVPQQGSQVHATGQINTSTLDGSVFEAIGDNE